LNSALEAAKHVAHGAGRGHDAVHDFFGQRQFAGAQLVKEVLRQMAQGDQLGGIEKTCPPLDRVKSPKNVVQQTVILWIFFQVNQLVVNARQEVGRFDQKIL
jgi:hypothetical protein